MNAAGVSGISIEGDGVAALCCAHLFSRSEIACSLSSGRTTKQPAILLGAQAASLLRDVCRSTSLLDSGWRIRKRVVLWGEATNPITVEHDGIAISEEILIAAMCSSLRKHRLAVPMSASWLIATHSSAHDSEFNIYGERRAVSYRVTLRNLVDSTSCWMESTPEGWLFLLPFNGSEASLIASGTDPESALRQSRLIVSRLSDISSASATVSIAPRIARTLCNGGVVRTGSAAMRFDPLCGEGAGHAVREAYLAVALIRAAMRGEPVEALLAHYTCRLQQAFLQHLVICSSFYSSGGSSDFWRAEDAALKAGIAELRSGLATSAPAQFRFRGLDLEAISPLAAL